MLKSVEDISSTKKRLTIEIPADVIESEMVEGYRKAQQQARIPGFRPGKVPMTMIEKKYGKGIENDVLEKLVPQFYAEALKEASLVPVARPEMEQEIILVRQAPITMSMTVEVRPHIENLSYEGIPVKDIPVEVTEEDVEAVLKGAAEERAHYEPAEGPVQTGDMLTVDYTVENEDASAVDALIRVGSGPYPPAFFDALIGKNQGDVFDVAVEFPETMPSSFAGKTPKFTITIKEIKRKAVLPIDDELAKDLGFDSLQALKDKVAASLEAERRMEVERVQQLELLEKLVEKHEFDVPEILLEGELKRMYEEAKSREGFLGTQEEYNEQNRDKAIKAVKATILIDIIGEKEKIEVTEDDLRSAIMGFSARFNIAPEQVVKYYQQHDGSLAGLRNSIFEKKTLKLLLEKAIKEKGVAA